MVASRCIIIDPVCAITYGHSLNSLHYFSSFSRKHFENVEIYASRHLPSLGKNDGINRFFNFYYRNLMRIESIPSRDHEFEEDLFTSQDDAAAYDFARLFAEADIDKNDTLLFPSADYHLLMGVSNIIRRMPESKRPRLLVRLINVMENAHSLGPNTLPIPVQRVAALKKEGYRISFSAETPKYGRFLTELAGTEFVITPYPSFPASILPLDAEKPFTVLCGGSGRKDKGFFRLIDIIENTNILNPNVKFIVQNLHDNDQYNNISYLNKLYAIPNVTILPGVLPYEHIMQSYADSHICLMPYDAATYEYRGSAILMESLLFGRQCVGQSGTGFAEQIELYGGGASCGSNSEMAQAIDTLSRTDRTMLTARASRAREAYIADVEVKYAAWMDGGK